MSHSRLTVPDVSCDACVRTIEGALEGLPGIEAIDVDFDRKLVTVDHDSSQLATDQLATAVEEQGYEVTAQEPG